jgi:hypothetical protein
MKTQILHSSKKMTWALALTVATTFGLTSCDKDDDGVIDPKTSLKVVHAVPNGGSVNFYVDGTKQNASAFGFGESTGYLAVASGSRTAEFKSSVNNSTILSAPITLGNGNYSLFATGITGDNTLTTVLVADNLQTPGTGKVRVRVAHVSPDAPTVNVLVNDSLLLANSAYKTVSGFMEIPARTYSIKLNNSASGGNVYTRNDVVLEAGKNYTLTAQGLVASPLTAPFSVNVITY